MKFRALAWLSVVCLVVLAGCSRETIALPAPAAPNVEWAALSAAAEIKIKALAPEATLVRVDGFVEINSAQRLMFTYTTADFTSLTVLITHENNTIRATEIFTGTINPAAENRQISDKYLAFPTTSEEMSDYQRRAAKVRVSPGEAVKRALTEDQTVTLHACKGNSLNVDLFFKRDSDAPVWLITRRCQPPTDVSVARIISYEVNSETGQVVLRNVLK